MFTLRMAVGVPVDTFLPSHWLLCIWCRSFSAVKRDDLWKQGAGLEMMKVMMMMIRVTYDVYGSQCYCCCKYHHHHRHCPLPVCRAAWGGSRQKTEWARSSMEGRGPSRGHSRPVRRGRPVPLPVPPPVGSDGAVVSAGRENRLPTAGTMRQLHAVSPCRVSDVCLFIRTFWAYTAVLFSGLFGVFWVVFFFAVSDTGQQVIMIKNKWYITC